MIWRSLGKLSRKVKQNKYLTKKYFYWNSLRLLSVNKQAHFYCCSSWNMEKKKKVPVTLTTGNVHARGDSMPVRAKTGHVATKHDSHRGWTSSDPAHCHVLLVLIATLRSIEFYSVTNKSQNQSFIATYVSKLLRFSLFLTRYKLVKGITLWTTVVNI